MAAAVAGPLETWTALTLLVCLGEYAWTRYRVSRYGDPEWGETAGTIGLLVSVGYVVATWLTGLPSALLERAAQLPDGVAVAAAAVPMVVGLWVATAVPNYAGLAHHERPEELSTANAHRALVRAGWFVLTWFGWPVVGAVALVQFGALLGALAGAVGYLALRTWYSSAFLLPTAGSVRTPTDAEAGRVRELFDGAIPERVPIRLFEPEEPAEEYAQMVVDFVGNPGRRRFVVDEQLLDAEGEAAAALFALTVESLRTRLADWLLVGRVLQLAVVFGAVGVMVPQVWPEPVHFLVLLFTPCVALPVLAGLEREFWDRIYELDRRAADAVGEDALAALLADYEGPPGDDRIAEFVLLHPSARRRLAALGASPEPDPADGAADSA